MKICKCDNRMTYSEYSICFIIFIRVVWLFCIQIKILHIKEVRNFWYWHENISLSNRCRSFTSTPYYNDFFLNQSYMIQIEGFVFIKYSRNILLPQLIISLHRNTCRIFVVQFNATLHILQRHLEQDVEYSYNYFICCLEKYT